MANSRNQKVGKPCCGDSCGGNCVCCPYGCTIVFPLLLTLGALFCTWGATLSCGYFEATYTNSGLFSSSTESRFGVGPWVVENFEIVNGAIDNTRLDGFDDDDDGDECRGWNDHETLTRADLDAPLKFSRFVSLWATLASLFNAGVILTAGCVPIRFGVLRFAACSSAVYAVLMLLSLVTLASDWCQNADECLMAGSGVTAIIAFVLWLLAGFSITRMREPTMPGQIPTTASAVEMELPPRQPPTAGSTTKTVEETIVEEDGTVVKLTTTTAVNPDGSRTVTETRQVVQQGAVPVAASPATATYAYEEDIPVAPAKAVQY